MTPHKHRCRWHYGTSNCRSIRSEHQATLLSSILFRIKLQQRISHTSFNDIVHHGEKSSPRVMFRHNVYWVLLCFTSLFYVCTAPLSTCKGGLIKFTMMMMMMMMISETLWHICKCEVLNCTHFTHFSFGRSNIWPTESVTYLVRRTFYWNLV